MAGPGPGAMTMALFSAGMLGKGNGSVYVVACVFLLSFPLFSYIFCVYLTFNVYCF